MNAKSVMTMTASVKKKKKTFKSIFLVFFLIFFIASCSKEEAPEDSFRMRMIDDWRFTFRRSFVIMSLKANGNWESQVREEGRFSKVVEKKGSQRGKWELKEDNKYIHITVDSGDDLEINWIPGNSYKYLISSLTEESLVLVKEDSGKTFEWTRIKSKKSASAPADGSPGITEKTTRMEPIIINLAKRNPFEKNRYVCISFDVVEELEVPVATEAELPPESPLDPRVRESLMLYLSSLKYKEINTFKEVKEIRGELETMISPYFGGRLKELKLENIIVAGTRGSLEEFIIQYSDQMVRFGLKPPEAPKPPEEEGKPPAE